jgi:hypothetical protein
VGAWLVVLSPWRRTRWAWWVQTSEGRFERKRNPLPSTKGRQMYPVHPPSGLYEVLVTTRVTVGVSQSSQIVKWSTRSLPVPLLPNDFFPTHNYQPSPLHTSPDHHDSNKGRTNDMNAI